MKDTEFDISFFLLLAFIIVLILENDDYTEAALETCKHLRPQARNHRVETQLFDPNATCFYYIKEDADADADADEDQQQQPFPKWKEHRMELYEIDIDEWLKHEKKKKNKE